MHVVIAEDAALLREGLTRLLQDRGHVVSAAVPDGDALLAAVAEHQPDVAVVDIRMPPTHTDEGLRAALKLRQDFPGTGVLVFSQYVETSYSAQLLEGGAAGVAAELVVSGGAVEKHVASIFAKLGLPPGESDNRRVLAVLRYLGG